MKETIKNRINRILLLIQVIGIVASLILLLVLPIDSPYQNICLLLIVVPFILVALVNIKAIIEIIKCIPDEIKNIPLRIKSLNRLGGTFKKPIMLITTIAGMIALDYLFRDLSWFFSDKTVKLVLDQLPQWLSPDNFSWPATQDLFGYYAAQLSLTFISISVMSVLSDKSVLIYWVNASEDRLIKPTFTCFAAYTYYSIGATIGAGAGVFSGNAPVFFRYFCANIVILILLTISMIDVYFGIDSRKKSLIQSLATNYFGYVKCRYKGSHSLIMRTRAESYENAMLGLCQNIYQSQAQSNLGYLKDVYALYFNNSCLFQGPASQKAIRAMVASVDQQTFPIFFDALHQYIQELNERIDGAPVQYLDESNNLLYYYWDVDEDMWAALSQSSYLKSWIHSRILTYASNWELAEFLFVLKGRIMNLHNDMVEKYAKKNNWDPKDYLLDMDKHGSVTLKSDGTPISQEKITQVFSAAFQLILVDSDFCASLMHILVHLLAHEEAAQGIAEQMSDFPIVNHFAAYAGMMGFSQEDTQLLQKYFPPMEIPEESTVPV